jgi:hypothetical protein
MITKICISALMVFVCSLTTAQHQDHKITLYQKKETGLKKKRTAIYCFELDTSLNTLHRVVLKKPEYKHNFNQFALPSNLTYSLSDEDKDTLIKYLPSLEEGASIRKGFGISGRRVKFNYESSSGQIKLRIAKRNVSDPTVQQITRFRDKMMWMMNKYYRNSYTASDSTTSTKDSIETLTSYQAEEFPRNEPAQLQTIQPLKVEPLNILKDYGQGMKVGEKKEGLWYHNHPYFLKKDTIAIGEYRNDQMVGVWKFYDHGQLVHIYDFTKDSLIFDEYRNEKVWENPGSADGWGPKPTGLLADKRPVFKGGRVWLSYLVYSHFQMTELMKERECSREAIVIYSLDSLGSIKEVKLTKGGGCGMEEEQIRISTFLDRWIPAELNGRKVEIETGYYFRM